ncbi:MAG: cobalamin B12-binding domain-containing protein [Alphaproteobacteria bacterium]|nr:cobalamin B12-binding domain-containing protein [Alphaproteobacteria bacterium]
MNERETIDRGWYYVIEPASGRFAPTDRHIVADDGRVLTRRLHGHPARVEVVDASGADLPVASWLRAAAAVGTAFEAQGHVGATARVTLAPAGAPASVAVDDGTLALTLDGPALAASPAHHAVYDDVAARLQGVVPPPVAHRTHPPGLPPRPVPRALFFESLMNTDMPHNDKEISQGVLHIISTLTGTGTEVVLVNAKMPIVGDDRPVTGLERLEAALADGPVHLVGITLLEGYWEGVAKLIATLRGLGCRAHIAVGGVMPSLAPEHVAAHLGEATFVCRGAGEAFLPSLARIVGTSTVDVPLTDAQREALLAMDGMIVIDRAGRRLLSCRSDRTLRVDDLDRVNLDLSYVGAHHIEGGIEISTSRGCIHRCTFCSILGRESYQARSSGSIFDVLSAYEQRFHALHGDRVPDNAYRVHISDDDFACDRPRARAFFEQLLDTRFRLSSVQVSVADLCRREGAKLLVEPDHELLDAIKAECFADHGRPIPRTDFFEDHKSRTWSSFLQIGVETYDDREIARLGKGYKRAHIRRIVAELAHRSLHMDGYFILSNADTEPEDLVDVFSEVARLKLRFPEHFHMRFPVVQHLVSYFTAATHRRHLRKGRPEVMVLRGEARVPSHPEYDYAFVDHDEPVDAWVGRTVARPFVTDRGLYTGNLDVIAAMWRTWLADLPADHPDRARIAPLLRALDDRPRRLVFEMLRQAWTGDDAGWPEARLDKERSLETAERVLGAHDTWLPLLRAWLRRERERRLVLVTADAHGPTAPARVDEALALLASSDEADLALHLMQPHGPVDADHLVALVDAARARVEAGRTPRHLRVLLDVDGWTPTPEVAAALAARHVEVVVVRRLPDAALPDGLAVLHAAGVTTRLVLQVPVGAVDALGAAWQAAVAAGIAEVALEPLPEGWEDRHASALGAALYGLAGSLDGATTLLDLHGTTERSGHLHDVLVDADGTIGRSDGLVPGSGVRATHVLGHLRDLTNLDRHHLELVDGLALSGATRVDELRRRRARADKVIARFAAWWRGRHAAPGSARDADADAAV